MRRDYSYNRSILAGEEVTLFDEPQLMRDFTYIDDAVAGILAGSLLTRKYMPASAHINMRPAVASNEQHVVLNIARGELCSVFQILSLLEIVCSTGMALIRRRRL